jgi:hypothetical protein
MITFLIFNKDLDMLKICKKLKEKENELTF